MKFLTNIKRDLRFIKNDLLKTIAHDRKYNPSILRLEMFGTFITIAACAALAFTEIFRTYLGFTETEYLFLLFNLYWSGTLLWIIAAFKRLNGWLILLNLLYQIFNTYGFITNWPW